MMMKTTTTTISQKSILSPSRRSRSSFKGRRSAFGEQRRGRIFCSRQDDDDFGHHHHHRMTTTKRKREKKKKGGVVCFSCADDEEEEALLTTAGAEASTLTSSLSSSFEDEELETRRASSSSKVCSSSSSFRLPKTKATTTTTSSFMDRVEMNAPLALSSFMLIPMGVMVAPNFDLEGPGSVIQALSVLASIIFVHESGHFLAARTQGIHVNKFAVGFGPNVLSYQGEEVEYSLKAIPLGGFVAFPDDDVDCPYPPDDPDLLRNRPVKDRAIVVSAGIVANCVFAFAILLAQVNTIGLTYAKYAPGVIVKGFVSPSAAESAGFKRGDIILRIDGEDLEADAKTVNQVVNKIKASANKKLDVVVSRKGEMVKLNLIPDETPKTLEGRVGTRLEANSVLYKKMAKGPVDSIKLASKEFGRLFTLVGKSLTGLVTNFSQSKDQVSGPLAIVAVGAEVVRKDISGLFQFGAVININLAIVNLLPLPALDGGFLLLLIIEAIRGKKMQKETEQSITGAGVLFLLISGGVLITRDLTDFAVKAFGLDL
jgi:membrane-associated protease RseP (regulator of RpoE activity)